MITMVVKTKIIWNNKEEKRKLLFVVLKRKYRCKSLWCFWNKHCLSSFRSFSWSFLVYHITSVCFLYHESFPVHLRSLSSSNHERRFLPFLCINLLTVICLLYPNCTNGQRVLKQLHGLLASTVNLVAYSMLLGWMIKVSTHTMSNVVFDKDKRVCAC